MIPLDVVAFAAAGNFLPPKDAPRSNLRQDYTLGGVGLFDASEGPRYQAWQCAYFDGAIQVRPVAGSSTWLTLRTIANISEVSLTFDARQWPVVAYVQSGVSFVSYFNMVAWVDIALGSGAITPMVAQDGASDAATALLDAVVVYLRGGFLCARYGSQNYGVEHQLIVAPPASSRVQRVGMSDDDRFLIELDGSERAVTAVLHDPLTDTLYCAAGALALPMRRGDLMTGTWRSRVVVMDGRPLYAWLRLDGPFESALVRVYGDGSLVYTTPAIVDDTPVRLPAQRFREVEFEVESASNVTGMALAHTAEELAQT